MEISRRALLGASLAAPTILRAHAAPAARVLKISHQFPASTGENGDFRDRLVQRFAAEVERRTNGELGFEIPPGSSLMKTVAQFGAVRRGALDFTLYPLAYAGGEVPEVNITLMPALVTSYDQGMAWKQAPIGRALTEVLERRGVKIITWIWQAGGIASRAGAVINPDDVKGQKVRGGSREVDLMFKAAGAISSSVASDEIYPAMQTGSLDAAVTSSTSLMSYRLQEIAHNVTTGRAGSFWFMFEPLLMAKSVFDELSAGQQAAILETGAGLEDFALRSAKLDDLALATVYEKAGVKVADFTPTALASWRRIAEATAFKDFSARNAACAELMQMAQAMQA